VCCYATSRALLLSKNFQFSSPLFFFGFRVEPQSASCLRVSVSCYLVCKRRWKGWNGNSKCLLGIFLLACHVLVSSPTPISFSSHQYRFFFSPFCLHAIPLHVMRVTRKGGKRKIERSCERRGKRTRCPDEERRPSSSLFDYYSLPSLFFLFSLTFLESFSSHFLLPSSFPL